MSLQLRVVSAAVLLCQLCNAAKHDSNEHSCAQWSTDSARQFRLAAEARWNQYRAQHQLAPIKILQDETKSLLQAANMMSRDLCKGKSVGQLTGEAFAYRAAYMSQEGKRFIDAIYCSYPKLLNQRAALKRVPGSTASLALGDSDWQQLLRESEPNEVGLGIWQEYWREDGYTNSDDTLVIMRSGLKQADSSEAQAKETQATRQTILAACPQNDDDVIRKKNNPALDKILAELKASKKN